MSMQWVTCGACRGIRTSNIRGCRACGGHGLVYVSMNFPPLHTEVQPTVRQTPTDTPDIGELVMLGILKIALFASSTFISVFVCCSAIIFAVRAARWLGWWP